MAVLFSVIRRRCDSMEERIYALEDLCKDKQQPELAINASSSLSTEDAVQTNKKTD